MTEAEKKLIEDLRGELAGRELLWETRFAKCHERLGILSNDLHELRGQVKQMGKRLARAERQLDQIIPPGSFLPAPAKDRSRSHSRKGTPVASPK